MDSKEKLKEVLDAIDGHSYKAYRELENKWFNFGDFAIGIPRVQGDPFARPSKVFIRVAQDRAEFPEFFLQKKIRRVAVEDYITRLIYLLIKKYTKGSRGSGKSGLIYIARIGQEVLERTSVEINDRYIEARLYVGLPARGRRVLGRQAADIFFEELSKIASEALFYKNINRQELRKHVEVIEDQEFLRKRLKEKGLVAFIANGTILPRRSGIDDRPLQKEEAVLFRAPFDFEVEFDLPYRGKIKGMGIPEGITLIVGGGYHGKSTLLKAIELGVYNHIPGDGREYVVTDEGAVKIRAEDGRRIEKVDISPFINNLPKGVNTTEFSTENASGSTSQAANIMEALELGATVLLIDEDTSATNFMIRDARMQRLVSGEKEPITPFIDRVRALYEKGKVSTILVTGGSGDYFETADQVIMMEEYLPVSVTEKAREIAEKIPNHRAVSEDRDFSKVRERNPEPDSINPERNKRVKIKSHGIDTLQFGFSDIDLSYLEQIVNEEQTRTIGNIILYMLREGIIDGKSSIRESLLKVFRKIDENGLELISPFSAPDGDYVRPRLYEVGATI
ncbi:MAG: ABC-ATPase domain-containing protein, partial [Halanaerobiaceae bacterium]|nr:ABC-ATPase domain-containing protein [Halanaerobiaceae bacterium]